MTENNMVLLDQPDLSRDVLCDLFAGCGGSGGGDANKTEKIKAIGNSVSHGVSRALGLAWYSQDPDVWKHVKHLHKEDNKAV